MFSYHWSHIDTIQRFRKQYCRRFILIEHPLPPLSHPSDTHGIGLCQTCMPHTHTACMDKNLSFGNGPRSWSGVLLAKVMVCRPSMKNGNDRSRESATATVVLVVRTTYCDRFNVNVPGEPGKSTICLAGLCSPLNHNLRFGEST